MLSNRNLSEAFLVGGFVLKSFDFNTAFGGTTAFGRHETASDADVTVITGLLYYILSILARCIEFCKVLSRLGRVYDQHNA